MAEEYQRQTKPRPTKASVGDGAGKLVDAIREDIETVIANLGGVSFEGMTILVTGGAGFLGSWICQTLVEQNARVICLDNLSSGLRTNVASLLDRSNFKFVEHDITEPVHIGETVDMVMHLASRASPLEFEGFALEILSANTLGTWGALEIARKSGARFVFASTSEVYGDPSLVPTPESYWGNVNPIGPRGCYDEAKRCGEAYAMAYQRQHNLDVRIGRIFNTYGPRMRADGIYGRAVPRLIDQALRGEPLTVFGTGQQTRSFCYITDQVEGLLRLASLPQANGEVVNIGNDEEVRIMDLAEAIRKLTDSCSEIIFQPVPQDDPERRCPDISKAKKILGWKPRVGLEEGLTKTINWFKRQELESASETC